MQPDSSRRLAREVKARFARGESRDAIVGDLIAGGWPADTAQDFVEAVELGEENPKAAAERRHAGRHILSALGSLSLGMISGALFLITAHGGLALATVLFLGVAGYYVIRAIRGATAR